MLWFDVWSDNDLLREHGRKHRHKHRGVNMSKRMVWCDVMWCAHTFILIIIFTCETFHHLSHYITICVANKVSWRDMKRDEARCWCLNATLKHCGITALVATIFMPTSNTTQHLTHTALFSCFLSHPPYTVHISLTLHCSHAFFLSHPPYTLHISLTLHYSHAFFLSHPPYTLHISLILHCLYQHMRRETKTNGHHAFIIFFFSFFFFHFVIFIRLKCITFI